MAATTKRYEALLKRLTHKQMGAISADVMTTIHAGNKVTQAEIALRHVEMEFNHALRGLEHPDYNELFAGWERADGSN